MTPRQLKLLFCFFPYAGNSTGTSVMFPVMQWWGETLLKARTDDKFKNRIQSVDLYHVADTPITMTRNKAVKIAQQQCADVLVMCDSDMTPDLYLGKDPEAVPFFDVAFNALYAHYDTGPLVIGAPYGGCPPHENMFVFTWDTWMNAGQETMPRIRQYERAEAQQMAGIQECAALPTGLIMYDMRAFDLLSHPYFRYEWTDDTETAKGSTEDVQNTRDIALACLHKYGYNPMRCAWSSWAGHNKVWCVGKPNLYTANDVAKTLVQAVERNLRRDEKFVDAEAYLNGGALPEGTPVLSFDLKRAM